MKNSTDSLDVADGESRKVRRTAAKATIVVSLLSTMLALSLGIAIAYRTAKSITQPLTNLMNVARGIGNTGDLEHNVELDRPPEIGELARTFHKMVTYLKEMAGVSESIAGGDLSVEVKPRSTHDTLGNAFSRMVEGLAGLVRSVRDASSQVASASNQVAGASDDAAKIGLQASLPLMKPSTMHEMSVNVQNMVKSTQVQASSVSDFASIDWDGGLVSGWPIPPRCCSTFPTVRARKCEASAPWKATDGTASTPPSRSGETTGPWDSAPTTLADTEVIDSRTNQPPARTRPLSGPRREHGLGFAVVADEVRKLAEVGAVYQGNSELIQSIQKGCKAVENMDRSTTIVNEGLGWAAQLVPRCADFQCGTEVQVRPEIGAATNEHHGSSQIARATTRLNEITTKSTRRWKSRRLERRPWSRPWGMRELVQSSTSDPPSWQRRRAMRKCRGPLEFPTALPWPKLRIRN